MFCSYWDDHGIVGRSKISPAPGSGGRAAVRLVRRLALTPCARAAVVDLLAGVAAGIAVCAPY